MILLLLVTVAENIYYTYIHILCYYIYSSLLAKQLVCAHRGGGGGAEGEVDFPKTCTQLPPKRKREEKERKNEVGGGA